jgi:hypothetical protein
MNGMSYVQHTFTLPASNVKQSELRWDLAFLDKKQFHAKYGKYPIEMEETAFSRA